MTVDVRTITNQRLRDWGDGCIAFHATPALLLAIGHDSESGVAHVFVPDDPVFDKRFVRQLLRRALAELNSVML